MDEEVDTCEETCIVSFVEEWTVLWRELWLA